MAVEVLTVSTKGQIALPLKIRKQLDIEAGDKFAVYVYGNTIVMKPIKLPEESDFEKDLKEAEAWAKSVGYKAEDVNDIIKSARKKKHHEDCG